MQFTKESLKELLGGYKNMFWPIYTAGTLLLLFLLLFIYFTHLSPGRVAKKVQVGQLNLGSMTKEQARKYLFAYENNVVKEPIFLHWEQRTWVFLPEYGGLNVDMEKTFQRVWQIGRAGNFLRRWQERIRANMYGINMDYIIATDKKNLDAYIRMLMEEIDRSAVPAQIVSTDKSGKPVVSAEIEGYRLQTNKLYAMLKKAILEMPSRHLQLPVVVEKPVLSKEDIVNNDFRLIGSFATVFDPAASERVQNLKLAVQAINGTVIFPGKTFSYNDIVGPRESNRGYLDAPVLIRGELVPGVGGGICQVSSTLYNAALLARVDIVERTNHSRLSAYVPPGQDATVLDKVIDLKLKNEFDTPLIINCIVVGSRVRVDIWGKDNFPEEKAKLVSVVDKVIPYTIVEKQDPTVEPGLKEVEKKGADGYEVSLYRVVTKAGKEIKRELISKSKYIAMPEVVKVGPPLPQTQPLTQGEKKAV